MRNEAQRCIYAIWPSTDMTFATQRNCFNFWAVDWTRSNGNSCLSRNHCFPKVEFFTHCACLKTVMLRWTRSPAVNILNLIWVFYEARLFLAFGLLLLCKHPAERDFYCIFRTTHELPKKRRIRLIFATKKVSWILTLSLYKNDGFLKDF